MLTLYFNLCLLNSPSIQPLLLPLLSFQQSFKSVNDAVIIAGALLLIESELLEETTS